MSSTSLENDLQHPIDHALARARFLTGKSVDAPRTLPLLCGASGLQCILIGREIMNFDWVQQWAGGYLMISSAPVVALFPQALLLRLSTAGAAVSL